jgi:formylglycine-generating enzyme required for sulfatase activity
MKQMNIILTLCLLMAVVTACTNDEYENVADSTSVAVPDISTHVTMHLVGGVTPFTSGDSATRAANDWEWQDRAVVYLQFYNGTERIRGHAVYTKSTDTWEVPTWAGTIGTKDKCEVYYFDGASTSNKTSVTLGSNVGVYADRSASYVYENGTVTVSAALKPQTSRIRFLKATGTSVSSIEVEGITSYATYDATTNTLTTTSGALSAAVGSTGYTAYIYGNFTDASSRQLGICNNVDGFDTQFRGTFGSSVLQTGHSGYITIPTEDTNKGWTVTAPETSRQFTVTGNGKTVTFTMKRVAAGTFQMGGSDSNAGSNEKPVHSVTLTKSYYMGETEVTQALWYAVMGQKPTSDDWSAWRSAYGLGDSYPAYNISYEDCESFISQLNNQLSSQLNNGEKFRFPTEAQWEYAARGGNRSQGYLYAGSNTIEDVAWYNGNSSSKAHEVKGKQANELGLYDMSGNVWEWCLDWYDSSYYSSSPATDPVNTTSASGRVNRGGSWNISAEFCRVAYRSNSTPTYRNYALGLRLALQ